MFGFFAGIRDALARFTRCPCAGRHLLFFAAAKKSRQKKAAHTASSSSCLRAPKGSYASHGNHVTDVRCQRSEQAPHLLRTSVLAQAAANGTCRPGGKLCVGCRTAHVSALTRNTDLATQSGVMRVRCESRHTVCHLGGSGLSAWRAVTRVYEAGEAYREGVGNAREEVRYRVKDGDVGGPWTKVKRWRCEPLSFAYFSLRRQRKVGAAPHRGDA